MDERDDRERLMAATSAEALFGEDLTDARALRRAYARWVKRFSPESDPEAFTHLRALYDAAKAAPAPAPEEPAPVPQAAPGARLAAAVENKDWSLIIDMVLHDPDGLLASDGALAAHAIEQLVMHVGPRLAESVVDQLELFARRPDLPLPPVRAEELEEDVVGLRALHTARRDDAVPEAFVTAMEGCWYRPPLASALALLELTQAPAWQDPSWTTHVARAHPSLITQLNRACMRVSDAKRWYAEASPPQGSVEAREALKRVVARDSFPNEAYRIVRMILIGVLVFIAIASGGLCVGVALWILLAAVADRTRDFLVRVVESRRPDPIARLLEVGREQVLFPHELVDAAVPITPVPMDHAQPYEDDHPLVRFEQDPWSLLHLLTPAHIERVTARVRAP